MQITPPRWLPQVEGYDADSAKFPSVKIPRFMSPVGLRVQQEGGKENNGAVYNLEVACLTWTSTQDANNFAPN